MIDCELTFCCINWPPLCARCEPYCSAAVAIGSFTIPAAPDGMKGAELGWKNAVSP